MVNVKLVGVVFQCADAPAVGGQGGNDLFQEGRLAGAAVGDERQGGRRLLQPLQVGRCVDVAQRPAPAGWQRLLVEVVAVEFIEQVEDFGPTGE